MLVLEMGTGQKIFLKKNGQDVGTIKYIKPVFGKKDAIQIGFELDQSIQILREKLLQGRDSGNHGSQT